MRHIRFHILLISAVMSLAAGEYSWILPGSKQLTSAFCEYRVGHFHAGMDLRTPEGIGMKIHAPCDGDIMRATVSPWGYGLALYYRCPGDFITVYGHLSRFSDAVQQRVRQEQYKNSKYPVDIWFKEGEIPVNAGEVIAYTGDTGAGSPHLHFETRLGMSKYINPFLMGFTVEDRVRPKIQGIYITPMGDDAYIQGYSEALGYRQIAPEGNSPKYIISDTVKVCGEVGISVRAFDWQADGNPNRMGIYELFLISGDKTLYYARYDSFLFDDTRQVGHAFDLFCEEWGGDRYHRLYRKDFLGAFPFLLTEEGAGTLSPKPGEVIPLRIVARDFFGNSVELTMTVKGVEKPTKAGFTLGLYDWGGAIVKPNWLSMDELEMVISTDGGTTWTSFEEHREKDYTSFRGKPGDMIRMAYSQKDGLKRRYYFVLPQKSPFEKKSLPIKTEYRVDEHYAYITFTSETPLGYPEEIAVTPATPFDFDTPTPKEITLRLPLDRLENRGYLVSIKLYDGRRAEATFISQEVTQEGLDFEYSDMQLKFNKNSLFHDSIRLIVARDSTAYGLYPASLVNPKMFRLWLKGDGLKGEYLARLWAGKLYHAGTDTTKAPGRPWISALSRTGGLFTVAQDTIPPEVKITNIGTSRITFTITDEGSGFGEEELPDTYIDGKWILNEFDADRDRSDVLIEDPLQPGEHELLIVAKDRVGNTIEIRRKFTTN